MVVILQQLTPLSFSSEVRLIEGPETFLALLGGQHTMPRASAWVKRSNLRTHSCIIDGLKATPTNLLKIGFSAANLPSCSHLPDGRSYPIFYHKSITIDDTEKLCYPKGRTFIAGHGQSIASNFLCSLAVCLLIDRNVKFFFQNFQF